MEWIVKVMPDDNLHLRLMENGIVRGEIIERRDTGILPWRSYIAGRFVGQSNFALVAMRKVEELLRGDKHE